MLSYQITKEVKQVRAKDIKQIKDQEELRSLIMKTANIYVAKVKGDDFENVIAKLLPPRNTSTT
jgi:hypothetical protein